MRLFFPSEGLSFPLPNLSGIQLESFAWFLKEGINEVLEEIDVIEDLTGRGWQLGFAKPRIDKPTLPVDEARDKNITYSAPWYLTATLTDTQKKKVKHQEIYMGELPLMTKKGSFIINGVEKVVINQLTRSEGVLFVSNTDPATGRLLAGAKILPKNGAWLEFETSKTGVISVKIDRKRRISATVLLRIFGLEDSEEILKTFQDVDTNEAFSFIERTLAKDPTRNQVEAQMEVYRKLRPGEPLLVENAQTLAERVFFNPRRYNLGRVGRFKLNQKLKLNFPNSKDYRLLQLTDLVTVIKRLIELNNGLGEPDDIDHLANRRVRSVGELLQHQLRIGFLQMERNIRERMSLQPRDTLCSPATIISSRPAAARINSFFTTGQLSQYLEQYNPMTELDLLRRLSVMGPGGLTRERASFSVRDAHYSHYGRICPVRTPEGPNIGLITYLALYAKVNEYGFLETPYRKLEKTPTGKIKLTKKIEYLAAYDEENYFITDSSVGVDSQGCLTDSQIPLRKSGQFFLGDVSLASYMDLVPQQIVGIAAALIPFLANDDGNRALVAAQQESQAVPLVRSTAPFIGTGLEETIADNAGAIIRAEEAGTVEAVDSATVVIKNSRGRQHTYPLQKFVKSNTDTCYNQRPVVAAGQKVRKNQPLAEGPCVDNGELALGANLKVAYMIWEGYNYDDAIIISERLVKDDDLTSIHIANHTIQVLETKLGPEEITADIPNVSQEALRNLDEGGVAVIGSKIKSGDILVGKIAPKGEQELSAEERLLRAIFGEKARDVRDNSLVLPHGEYGTVIGIRELSKDEGHELPTGVLREITVYVAQMRKVAVGDKLAGRHGNKGVIAKILPEEDMPYLPDGTSIDIIMHPASVVARMNLGQVLETHLGWVAEKTGQKYAVPAFTHFEEEDLTGALKKAGLPVDGKTVLHDGRTGRTYDQTVVVGNAYVMKLHHMAEEKMHARSTGPYSLITQQPLGGKAQMGGQRFGEMEVWALEAYSAAATLQEMITIKSDDMLSRTEAYKAILQGEPIPKPRIPESFKLLVRELNGLGLAITPLGKPDAEDNEKDTRQKGDQKDNHDRPDDGSGGKPKVAKTAKTKKA